MWKWLESTTISNHFPSPPKDETLGTVNLSRINIIQSKELQHVKQQKKSSNQHLTLSSTYWSHLTTTVERAQNNLKPKTLCLPPVATHIAKLFLIFLPRISSKQKEKTRKNENKLQSIPVKRRFPFLKFPFPNHRIRVWSCVICEKWQPVHFTFRRERRENKITSQAK